MRKAPKKRAFADVKEHHKAVDNAAQM